MIRTWRAPGRVNLIGEHTDYNGGFVLPFAIQHGCTTTVSPRDDSLVRITSAQRHETIEADALLPGSGGWAAYVIGVVWTLRDEGLAVPGLDIHLDSDVPIGAGLSSSAAIVCSVATALDDALGLGLTSDDLLHVTRRAENDFVGAPTGGMDQLAALRCTAGNALFCDMRSLETQAVPLDLEALAILVVDSKVQHRHAGGEYRRRRSGCEQAAQELGVAQLRDVSDLDAALPRLSSDELRRYTRHVVTENERVLRTVALLRQGVPEAVGPLLTESHASMRDDFAITVAEVDAAVEVLIAEGALGARMTGGGFGGCVIGLISSDRVSTAVDAVRSTYADRGWQDPVTFVAVPSAGAHPA